MFATMRSILKLTILLVLCLSCASSNKLVSKNSSSLQKANEKLNNTERRRAVESYRLMRLRDKQSKLPKKYRTNVRKKRIKRAKPIKIIVQTAPKPKPLTEEQIMEIEQNLTYFCMKNRKNIKYRNKNICRGHTQSKYEECKTRYKQNPRINVVRCVKNMLNL
jgi:hypothetical protein